MSRTRRKFNPPASARYYVLRRPKTQAERRAAESAEIKPRAKRNARNLPTAWDDKPIAALRETDHKA